MTIDEAVVTLGRGPFFGGGSSNPVFASVDELRGTNSLVALTKFDDL